MVNGYQQSIGPGTILRTVRDEQDIDRYAAFHAAGSGHVYGSMSKEWCEVWGITCDYLLRHHPEISYDDFLLVEDESTGTVVSTTCLIPWHCRYEDAPLEVAMLEMVATHQDHRNRGYVRAQIDRFHQMVDDRRFDLSIVWGIPYYYRQYGYAYAIDLQGADSLPAGLIPNPADGKRYPYKLRKAVVQDAPALMQLYRESMAAVQLHDSRDLDYWQFLLQWMQYPVQVVEEQRSGHVVGYICIDSSVTSREEKSAGTKIVESAIANRDAAMFVLQQLKAGCEGEVRLGWPQTNMLVEIGRSLGSTPLPVYQWLLRIPDVARLLSKIGPILERRVAASALAGLTADVRINLFQKAFVLQFKQGKLLKVGPAGFVNASVGSDGGDICIPPDAFVRLVFGYSQVEKMRDGWPDIAVRPESRCLVDVLFPKMTSFFCMPWQYYGPATKSSG